MIGGTSLKMNEIDKNINYHQIILSTANEYLNNISKYWFFITHHQCNLIGNGFPKTNIIT